MSDHTNVIIPASPADRKKLKMMLGEITHLMSSMELDRGSKKGMVDAIFEEFDIPKKTISKLANAMYKRNYEDIQVENSDFEMLYETLMGSTNAEYKEELDQLDEAE